MKKTRLPRKLKKKISKIPIGGYCYGLTGRQYHKQRKKPFKGSAVCPFFSGKKTEFSHCAFLNVQSDMELTDQVKICGK